MSIHLWGGGGGGGGGGGEGGEKEKKKSSESVQEWRTVLYNSDQQGRGGETERGREGGRERETERLER